AVAQLSISPAIGVYIPTTELVKAVSGQEYKQEVSITLGGRVALNVGRRAGIEATVDYAPSKLKFSATGSSSTTDADILSASGRVFVELLPPANALSLQLHRGAGLVGRTGTAYQGDPDKSGAGVGPRGCTTCALRACSMRWRESAKCACVCPSSSFAGASARPRAPLRLASVARATVRASSGMPGSGVTTICSSRVRYKRWRSRRMEVVLRPRDPWPPASAQILVVRVVRTSGIVTIWLRVGARSSASRTRDSTCGSVRRRTRVPWNARAQSCNGKSIRPSLNGFTPQCHHRSGASLLSS